MAWTKPLIKNIHTHKRKQNSWGEAPSAYLNFKVNVHSTRQLSLKLFACVISEEPVNCPWSWKTQDCYNMSSLPWDGRMLRELEPYFQLISLSFCLRVHTPTLPQTQTQGKLLFLQRFICFPPFLLRNIQCQKELYGTHFWVGITYSVVMVSTVPVEELSRKQTWFLSLTHPPGCPHPCADIPAQWPLACAPNSNIDIVLQNLNKTFPHIVSLNPFNNHVP